jgi:solute carrier family 1 (high affinity glutamate transporter) protein 1
MSASLDVVVAPDAVALRDLNKVEAGGDTATAAAAAADTSPSIINNSALRNVIRIMREQVKENLNLVATIIAVILGISLGFLLRIFFQFNDNQIGYFGFLGQLFLRMLKFLILPLIATSLISGIASLGSNSAGKIAMRALIYYFSTTITAVVIGIILVIIIRPGVGKGSDSDRNMRLPIDTTKTLTTHDTLLDLVRYDYNLFFFF